MPQQPSGLFSQVVAYSSTNRTLFSSLSYNRSVCRVVCMHIASSCVSEDCLVAHERCHLSTTYVTDDLPLNCHSEPAAFTVIVRDATLVSRQDAAGRCTLPPDYYTLLSFAPLASPIMPYPPLVATSQASQPVLHWTLNLNGGSSWATWTQLMSWTVVPDWGAIFVQIKVINQNKERACTTEKSHKCIVGGCSTCFGDGLFTKVPVLTKWTIIIWGL